MGVECSEDAMIVYVYTSCWTNVKLNVGNIYMLCLMILTLKYYKFSTCKFNTETTLKFIFTANVETVVLFQLVRQQRVVQLCNESLG